MREIVLFILGILVLLAFLIFQVDYFIKAEEIRLIEKNMYYDSLLLEEQKQLKEKDSLIFYEEGIIRQRLKNHEQRLRSLEQD